MSRMNSFTYKSEQIHSLFEKGKGYTRRNIVEIQGDKGIKAVETYDVKGSLLKRNEKKLNATEMICIQKHKFIPGLFQDCIKPLKLRSKKSKTRKQRK